MQKDNKELFEGLYTGATIGFYMVSSVAAGVLLGRSIDSYSNSSPWGTVLGIIFGKLAGMWALYKKVVGGK